jgi:hypothetical protein
VAQGIVEFTTELQTSAATSTRAIVVRIALTETFRCDEADVETAATPSPAPL